MFLREEVVPGVWRVSMARRFLGRDLYPCACYMVPRAELMVDSGSAYFARRTVEEARLAGVRRLLLTHSHEDHTGGAFAVASALGAHCLAHPLANRVLQDPASLRMLAYRRFMFGIPPVVAADPPPDRFEGGGMRFRVLPAPGHSPDHVVAFEEERGWLFAGDVYIPVRERVFYRTDCDLSTWVDTLRRLSRLAADRMFTGMGPVDRRPSRSLANKAERLSAISERVVALRRQGAGEAEIAKRLFPGDLAVRLFTGGDYSAVNIVRACLRSPASVGCPGDSTLFVSRS